LTGVIVTSSSNRAWNASAARAIANETQRKQRSLESNRPSLLQLERSDLYSFPGQSLEDNWSHPSVSEYVRYAFVRSIIRLSRLHDCRLTSESPLHRLTNSIATMLKRHTRRARGRRRWSHIKAIIRIFLSISLADVSSRRAAPARDIAARVSGLSESRQPPRPPRGGVAGSNERSRSLDGPIEHRPSDRTSIGIPVPSRSSAATTNLPRPSARVFAPQADDTGYERVNRAEKLDTTAAAERSCPPALSARGGPYALRN
jgi:hypothetical protein